MALMLFGFIYWQTAVHERIRIDALVTREAVYVSRANAADAEAVLLSWLTEDLHAVRYAGLFGMDGGHVAGNLLDAPTGLIEDGVAHRAIFVGISRDRDGDEPEVVRAVAVRLVDGRLIVLGYDIDELEDVEEIIIRALGLGLLPAVSLSLVGGIVLAQRAQRRIGTIHQALDRIMRGHLSERLPVGGSGDEMDRLASAVNGMLHETERLVGDIRAIGDNIAHDLRTPLTRVRTRLERGREEADTPEAFQICIDRAIVSVDQALSVVSAVLRIGEIEHGRRKAGFSSVFLSEIARDGFELYEPLAEEKGLKLVLRITAAEAVYGDRDLLLEAVGNILDNAIKFAPEGSELTLSVSGSLGWTCLCITDRGKGIPPAERGRVLQRFYRGEKSRTADGNGLGLNIVSAIVSLHGFELSINDAKPGCAVSIDCPIIEPSTLDC